MTFLQTSLLWGLFSATLPLIIHLVNRSRHAVMPWAAMVFLLAAIKESRGKRKLIHLLILTCRVLCILALFFALSRPLIGGFLGWGSGEIETLVIVMDRSASMGRKEGGERCSALGIQKAIEAIGQVKVKQIVLIDNISKEATVISDREALKRIESLQKPSGQSFMPSLITRALDVFYKAPQGRGEMWIISDMQRSNWLPDSPLWKGVSSGLEHLKGRVTTRIIDLSSKKEPQASLALRSIERLEDRIVLSLELQCDSALFSSKFPLVIEHNGVRKTAYINASKSMVLFKKTLLTESSTVGGYGAISLPEDSHTSNDVVYFSYGALRQAEVSIFAENEETREWLTLLSAPPGFSQRKVKLCQKASDIGWDTSSLIFWQGTLPQGALAQRMHRYIQRGGQVVFFPKEQGIVEQKQGAFPHFLGFSFQQGERALAGEYFTLSSWKKDRDVLGNGEGDVVLPLRGVKAIQRVSLEGQGEVLAFWQDKKPCILVEHVGRGRALFCGSLPSYAWSNLADGALLLPVIARMSQEGMAHMIPPSIFEQGQINRPPNNSKILSKTKDLDLGVWKTLSGDYQSINLPAAEYDATLLAKEALDELFGEAPLLSFGVTPHQSSALVYEISTPFLIASCLFLLVEAWLSLPAKKSRVE